MLSSFVQVARLSTDPEYLKKQDFPAETLTEDMDLTFTIHRKKLGKIIFTQESEVLTQDPKTLKEYIKQVDRWYTGFWMCVSKHKIPWGGQTLDLEAAMLASEGVFNGLLSIFFLIGVPVALLTHPLLLVYPLALDLLLFSIPTLLYMTIKYKMPKIFLYLPIFYLFRILNSIIFFRSFLKSAYGINKRKKFTWDTARYALEKEGPWDIQPSQ
jgi:biofilm PGA synthesis N-glycosyltransferase PgaC